MCVGITTMSGQDMLANEMKGKGVTTLHCYGDQLWYVCIDVLCTSLRDDGHNTVFILTLPITSTNDERITVKPI